MGVGAGVGGKTVGTGLDSISSSTAKRVVFLVVQSTWSSMFNGKTCVIQRSNTIQRSIILDLSISRV